MSHRILFAAMLCLAAVPAFAQEAVPAPAPAAAPATDAPREDAMRKDASVDRYCLRETGTHIRKRAKSNARGDCPSVRAGRVYTQEDLRSTGQVDIADALRMLDTSIR